MNYLNTARGLILAAIMAVLVAPSGTSADTTSATADYPVCTSYEALNQCLRSLSRTPIDVSALNFLFDSGACVFNTPGQKVTVLSSKFGGYRRVRLYGKAGATMEAWTVVANIVRE